jgi:preprotein translocase subunit SecG
MEKMTALLAAIAVLVVIALFAFSGYVGKASVANQNPQPETQSDAQVSSVISDQYSSMLNDQLNTQTVDLSYTAQMQDGIANDMSKFYA